MAHISSLLLLWCAALASLGNGLMSPDQARTLFHEFGHALHSLLSRTEFQHLAGECICSCCHAMAVLVAQQDHSTSQLVLSWHVSESSPGVLSYLQTCSVLMAFAMLVPCLKLHWALL